MLNKERCLRVFNSLKRVKNDLVQLRSSIDYDLKKVNEYNIEHKNDFEVLVYNSPYQILNRKNEIVVSIKYNKIMRESKISNIKRIYLGGGCFWCTEAIFENVIGVINVSSGYAGGEIKNPSYKEVLDFLSKNSDFVGGAYSTHLN